MENTNLVFDMCTFSMNLRMPRRGRARKPKASYRRRCGNAYALLPEPAGVPVPMCFCGDRCKVAESEEEETY
ncbi:unnamed protein product, partial [Urochloa humidicola]